MGQESGRSTVQVARLCSMMPEFAAGRLQSRGLKWSAGFFAYKTGSGCWLLAGGLVPLSMV